MYREEEYEANFCEIKPIFESLYEELRKNSYGLRILILKDVFEKKG